MDRTQKHVVIVAGEASGDMHAAHLIEDIRRIDPDIHFYGLGGSHMKHAGAHIYYDLTALAVIGFTEVFSHYPALRRAFNLIVKHIHEIKPDAVILVDYPGFNLRLAKKIRSLGIKTKIIYYISPQVWAWKKNRVFAIKKHIDHMLVFFPFEETFYLRFRVPVTFVGNPLLDTTVANEKGSTFRERHGLADYRLTIGILPGSRHKEIKTLLPIMLSTARLLLTDFPMLQFMVIKAPTIQKTDIETYTRTAGIPVTITDDNTYNAINACDVCMVASGTATLETALLGKPMVVVYKTSFLTWLLATLVIKIPYISLVNIIAGTLVVPECIQFQATPTIIATKLKDIFTNEIRLAEIKEKLRQVRTKLGTPGASKKAAEKVVTLLRH